MDGILVWYFAIYFIIAICAAGYYAADGGFHSSRGELIVTGFWALAMGTAIFFGQPLTWFGWVLICLFSYDTLVAFIDAGRHPAGKNVRPFSLVVGGGIGIACLILLLTVGITV